VFSERFDGPARHLGIFDEGGAPPFTGPAFIFPPGTRVKVE